MNIQKEENKRKGGNGKKERKKKIYQKVKGRTKNEKKLH